MPTGVPRVVHVVTAGGVSVDHRQPLTWDSSDMAIGMLFEERTWGLQSS